MAPTSGAQPQRGESSFTLGVRPWGAAGLAAHHAGDGSTHLSKVAARMYLPFGENFTNDTGGLSSSARSTETAASGALALPGRGAPSPPPALTPPLAGVPQGRPPPSPTARASVRASSPSDPVTRGLQERRPCSQSASGSPSSREGVCKHPAKPRNYPPENAVARVGAPVAWL